MTMAATTSVITDKLLKICSYNMHGFNTGNAFLKELCINNDIIFVQEHWLLSQHLVKFNNINDDFFILRCISDECSL